MDLRVEPEEFIALGVDRARRLPVRMVIRRRESEMPLVDSVTRLYTFADGCVQRVELLDTIEEARVTAGSSEPRG